MSRAPVEWRLRQRAETMNTCTCCGMPFASIGRGGAWADLLNKFEDVYAQQCPRAGGCFDSMQEAHLMHGMQREEGASCMDDHFFSPDWPNGFGGKGMQRRRAPAAAAGGGGAAEQGEAAQVVEEGEADDAEAEEARRQEEEAEARRQEEEAEAGPVTRARARRRAGQGGAAGGVGMFLQVDAVPNAQGVWNRMQPINIDRMLRRLARVMVADSQSGAERLYRDFIDTADNNDYWPEIYDVTFPACVRCNTLMTMIQRSTNLMVALKALDKDWFKTGQASRSLAVRKYRYGLLIRKSVKQAEQVIGQVDERLSRQGGADDGLQPVQPSALVQLMQSVFLAMAAATACSGTGEDEADHFRYAGIRSLYNSAVMWVLCRIRWSSAFRTPFHRWHIHYAENMPLAQKRCWHRWLFGGHEPAQLGPGKRITSAGIGHMLHDVFQPAFLALMRDDDAAAARPFERAPSIWQLMYLCVGNVRALVFQGGAFVPLEADTARFFPHREYPQWISDRGYQNAARLDTGAWVDALGPHVAFRRMVVCAVFRLPSACATLLLEKIREQDGDAAGAGAGAGAGAAADDLLQRYQEFMFRHYQKMDHTYRQCLRGGRRDAVAALDPVSRTDDFDAAAGFDRVTAQDADA